MFKMNKPANEIRDELLKHVKQNKSLEYRNGYVDGVLDFFNEVQLPVEVNLCT